VTTIHFASSTTHAKCNQTSSRACFIATSEVENSRSAYLAAELLNAADDLAHVSSVVQVDRLEQTGLWHSVRRAEVHERLNVLHLRSSPVDPQCHGRSMSAYVHDSLIYITIFSERELTLTFTFAICYRPSVCLPSVVCLSVWLSVCNARAPYSGGCKFRQFFYCIWLAIR